MFIDTKMFTCSSIQICMHTHKQASSLTAGNPNQSICLCECHFVGAHRVTKPLMVPASMWPNVRQASGRGKPVVECWRTVWFLQVMPFSTACNTPLSNFESGQNYKDVVDPAGMLGLFCVSVRRLYRTWFNQPFVCVCLSVRRLYRTWFNQPFVCVSVRRLDRTWFKQPFVCVCVSVCEETE